MEIFNALFIFPHSVVAKKKTKLTHLAFNPIHPIIIAGDDRYFKVSSFRLTLSRRELSLDEKNCLVLARVK